jgi:hypothetical protein
MPAVSVRVVVPEVCSFLATIFSPMKRFAVQVRITAIHVRVFLGYVRVLGARQVSRRCPCTGICPHFKAVLASMMSV